MVVQVSACWGVVEAAEGRVCWGGLGGEEASNKQIWASR